MACDGDGTPTPTNEPEQVEQPSTGTPTPGGGSGGGGAPSTPGAPSPQPTDPCDDLFDGFVRNIIVFGGSYVGNIKAHGPALSQQIPKWTTDRNGIPIAEDNLISYPGYGDNISGKALQAENARRVVAPCDVILIAYSAGTESALMYAKWRVSQGLPVRAIALLGPTFTSYNETQNPDDPNNIPLVFGTTPFDEKGFLDENTLVYNDWSDYVSYLLLKNVDILVWDDAGDKAVGYTKPANATGSFERLHRTNYTHFGTGNNSTNDSDIAKKEVYDWIYSH